MLRKDYYGILGVARDAGESEIKVAYRKLALQNHPDTNREDPGAEDRFKEINEAYDVLSHREKRDQYDLDRDPLGAAPFRPSPYDPWSDPFEADFFAGFRCRGGGFARILGRRRRVFRGTEVQSTPFDPFRSGLRIHELPLASYEAFQGTERDIRVHTDLGTQVFTVSIPAGTENGTLLRFKHPVGEGREIECLFRVRISK